MDAAVTAGSGSAGPPAEPPGPPSSIQQVRDCLAQRAGELQRYAYARIARSGMVSGPAVRELAREVVQETALEALQSAARFQPGRSVWSWIVGVLLNILLRRRSEIYTQSRRTLHPGSADEDGEIFDWLAQRAGADPSETAEEQLAAAQGWDDLVAPLSGADREIVELIFKQGLDGEAAAARLGIKPNAVRQRLHRAVAHLKQQRDRGGTP